MMITINGETAVNIAAAAGLIKGPIVIPPSPRHPARNGPAPDPPKSQFRRCEWSAPPAV